MRNSVSYFNTVFLLPAFSQTDIIRSGDFSDFTQWNLDAGGSHALFQRRLTVQTPTPELKPGQFSTQKEVRLDSGKVCASHSSAADMERTIEAAVGRMGRLLFFVWPGYITEYRETVFRNVFSMRQPGILLRVNLTWKYMEIS